MALLYEVFADYLVVVQFAVDDSMNLVFRVVKRLLCFWTQVYYGQSIMSES
jgi:hypothetical protein